MKSNYKPLGDYIKEVNLKNKDLKEDNLLGVSISKKFIPSIANTHGTNFKNYKVIKYNQFAYGPVTSRNGDKISIALLKEKSGIISPSYKVFSIIEEDVLYPDYLRLWVEREEFDRYARFKSHGSVREIFSWEELCNTLIPVPDIKIQHKIVKIDNIITNRIKIKENINNNLENTIKSIFKYFFIDFVPFKDNLVNGVPHGWKYLNLFDVVSDANTGADAIKKAPIVDTDTGIKCVRVGDMTNSRRFNDWAFSDVNEENFKKYQLKKDDIIVTRTATLGLNLLINEDLNAVYNNGLIRIKLDKSKVFPLFIFYCLKTSQYTQYIDSIKEGSSTRPNMKINYLLKFPIICPPLKVQEEFINVVGSLFELKENLILQIVELEKLKNTLLPKLMNGEIDISKINCD